MEERKIMMRWRRWRRKERSRRLMMWRRRERMKMRKMIQGNNNPECKHKNEDDDALSLIKASVGGLTK